jgi:hypothetical protein
MCTHSRQAGRRLCLHHQLLALASSRSPGSAATAASWVSTHSLLTSRLCTFFTGGTPGRLTTPVYRITGLPSLSTCASHRHGSGCTLKLAAGACSPHTSYQNCARRLMVQRVACCDISIAEHWCLVRSQRTVQQPEKHPSASWWPGVGTSAGGRFLQWARSSLTAWAHCRPKVQSSELGRCW